MESLPDVVFWKIAESLDGKELSTWSCVSRACREKLNLDQVWRSVCDPELAVYLKHTECEVQPFFISPEIPNSGLSAICDQRLCFMRQIHLWNNWRNFRHYSYFLPARYAFTHSFKVGLIKAKKRAEALFFENDYLIVTSNDSIEVWNIKESLVPVCIEPLLTVSPIDLFQLCGDKVVVKQRRLVQVFKISIATNQLIFLHSFMFDGTEKNTSRIYDDQVRSASFLECDDQAALVENVFIGMWRNLPKILHLWNVETGKKLKEERLEVGKYNNFYRETTSNEPYVSTTITALSRKCQILIYRLPDFVQVFATPEYNTLPTVAVVIQDYVFVHSFMRIDVYSLTTGQILFSDIRTSRENCHPIISNVKVWNGSIIFQGGGSLLRRFTPGINQFEDIPLVSRVYGILRILSEKYFLIPLDDENGLPTASLAILKGNRVQLLTETFFRSDQNVIASQSKHDINAINQTKTKLILNDYKESHSEMHQSRMKLFTFW